MCAAQPAPHCPHCPRFPTHFHPLLRAALCDLEQIGLVMPGPLDTFEKCVRIFRQSLVSDQHQI